MRTTVTLNEDVFKLFEKYIKEKNLKPKDAFNHLMRLGLSIALKSKKNSEFKFNPPTFKGGGGMMPGFSEEMSFSEMEERLDEEEYKS
jgi:hypothetical protein